MSKLELILSFGLGRRRCEVVPLGDLRDILRSPLGWYLRLILAWRCSRYLTPLTEFSQPSVIRLTEPTDAIIYLCCRRFHSHWSPSVCLLVETVL